MKVIQSLLCIFAAQKTNKSILVFDREIACMQPSIPKYHLPYLGSIQSYHSSYQYSSTGTGIKIAEGLAPFFKQPAAIFLHPLLSVHRFQFPNAGAKYIQLFGAARDLSGSHERINFFEGHCFYSMLDCRCRMLDSRYGIVIGLFIEYRESGIEHYKCTDFVS